MIHAAGFNLPPALDSTRIEGAAAAALTEVGGLLCRYRRKGSYANIEWGRRASIAGGVRGWGILCQCRRDVCNL